MLMQDIVKNVYRHNNYGFPKYIFIIVGKTIYISTTELLKWIGTVPVVNEKSSVVNPDKEGPKRPTKTKI